MTSELNNSNYMAFPLEIGEGGAAVSSRLDHVREQIEQVLFTNPGERWFRPEFGGGVTAAIFEPNSRELWEVTKQRVLASLTDALSGEVDPKTLEVTVDDAGEGAEKLVITIAYTLAPINHSEQLRFELGGE